MRLQAAFLTDIGRQRQGSVNQDSLLSAQVQEAQVFAVADGMGGHQAGDKAAQLALATFQRTLERQRGPWPQRAVQAADQANRAVYREAVGDCSGMGTTLLAAIFARGVLHLAHVGDSRAYLLRGDSFFRLTDDHSWVADQVRAGELTPEQAETHRWRNVVSNAVGGEEELQLELLSLPLQPGDRLLLCTDGLYVPVSDYHLFSVLSLPGPPESLVKRLVSMANQMGGPDNITAVVIDVQDIGAHPARPQRERWHEGPVAAERLLGEMRQGTPLSYLLLGAAYLTFLLLVLLPPYRILIGAAGAAVIGTLAFYDYRSRQQVPPLLRPEMALQLHPISSAPPFLPPEAGRTQRLQAAGRSQSRQRGKLSP